jgi:hypothetical protein
MSTSQHIAFRAVAGVVALIMAACGVAILVLEAPNNAWYHWLGAAIGQFLFAWAFGAYAIGIRGPFNWRGRGS